MSSSAISVPGSSSAPLGTVTRVLIAVSVAHMINDTIQALLPAIYPMLKESYALSFTQIGIITFVFQMTGSVLQPVVGWYSDKKPQPYSLALGMSMTLIGLTVLGLTRSYSSLLIASACIGIGSSVFHPEASRMARMASGGRHGFAQSLFQLGGNFGSALGPALAAAIIIPHGQRSALWFVLLAATGIVILTRVGHWYSERLVLSARKATAVVSAAVNSLTRRQVLGSIAVLIALLISKFVYIVSITSFYTFYLIEHFHVSVQQSQVYLFVFLLATAAGTIIGARSATASAGSG